MAAHTDSCFEDTTWFAESPFASPGVYSWQYINFTKSAEYTLYVNALEQRTHTKSRFDLCIQRWNNSFNSCMRDPHTDIEDLYDLFALFEDIVIDTLSADEEKKTILHTRAVADILQLRKKAFNVIEKLSGEINQLRTTAYEQNTKYIELTISRLHKLG